jgi:hypothetical protein
MAVPAKRRHLVLVRAPEPVPDVSFWRMLRIAGLIVLLGPVVLAGLGLAIWIVYQVAAFAFLVVGA